MPKCSTCDYKEFCNMEDGRKLTRLRKCTNAILNSFINRMSKCHANTGKGKVLEVGFGASHDNEKRINGTGTLEWFGIDPRWHDHPERNIFNGTVSHMPFPDGFFDIVIASNSMEHWEEFDRSCKEGLNEIWRVLKKDGVLLNIVPMQSHGSRMFRLNRVDKVEFMFNKWKMSSLTSWKNDINPSDMEYMLEIEAVK